MESESPLLLLQELRKGMSQQALAAKLNTSQRTIARWEHGHTRCPAMVAPALRELLQTHGAPSSPAPSFTFADLFAGIGGIRLGFQRAGGECVFTSEWNEWSQRSYANYFGKQHPIAGDITKIEAREIPDHDILLAGFPCQPFSIAGVSKKNALGRKHGFADEAQGTLFFDVARIIGEKQPVAFLLENVKNLVSHDNGNTFRVICRILEEKLGYTVHCRVIDARPFVPQHRERILIVGFRDKTDFTWDDLRLPEEQEWPDIASILHPEDGSEKPESHYTTGDDAKVDGRYTLSPRLWQYLQEYAAKHQAAGNGFGFGLVRRGKDHYTRTLSARYYKDGSEILIHRGPRRRPRRLTPRECARLMGFPEDFGIVVSDTQAYKQFGNSVVVPVIEAAAKIIVPRALDLIRQRRERIYQPALFAATA